MNKMTIRFFGLGFSLLIHIFLLMLIGIPLSCTREIHNQPEHIISNVRLIPVDPTEPIDSEHKLLLLRQKQLEIREKAVVISPLKSKCNTNKEYVGVGLAWYPNTHLIFEAPITYPAYKAGIRIGDYIVDPDDDVVQDGYMIIDVIRGYQKLHFRIKTAKICYTFADK